MAKTRRQRLRDQGLPSPEEAKRMREQKKQQRMSRGIAQRRAEALRAEAGDDPAAQADARKKGRAIILQNLEAQNQGKDLDTFRQNRAVTRTAEAAAGEAPQRQAAETRAVTARAGVDEAQAAKTTTEAVKTASTTPTPRAFGRRFDAETAGAEAKAKETEARTGDISVTTKAKERAIEQPGGALPVATQGRAGAPSARAVGPRDQAAANLDNARADQIRGQLSPKAKAQVEGIDAEIKGLAGGLANAFTPEQTQSIMNQIADAQKRRMDIIASDGAAPAAPPDTQTAGRAFGATAGPGQRIGPAGLPVSEKAPPGAAFEWTAPNGEIKWYDVNKKPL